MSTLLYEELGIQKDASSEHIRKAYKKKALLTHPDRLPPNATPEQKAASEEMFRKVNNAYEVLSDPEKRKEYDIHGVWPPPERVDDFADMRAPSGSHARRSHRSQSYHDRPFFSRHHHDPFSAFHFTDPFTLFDSIFGGSQFQSHNNMFRSHTMGPFGNMSRMENDIEEFMNGIDRDPFGSSGFPSFSPFPAMPMFSRMESSSFGGSRSGWTSESFSTRTVNGVTESVHQRIDSQGNEHITRTLSDGQELRFINGVEQPSHRRSLDNPTNRYLPSSAAHAGQSRRSTSRTEYVQPSQSHSYTAPPAVYRAQTPPSLDTHHQDRVHRRSSNRSKFNAPARRQVGHYLSTSALYRPKRLASRRHEDASPFPAYPERISKTGNRVEILSVLGDGASLKVDTTVISIRTTL
ncbi:hypothetical protein CVT24_006309 [Panaeolus cyanescens]|uniref:J domain-containing protein n=1 Tax=Panaeolus cyanescens TaxID=181874 RepID=A0A409V8M6_9AGAR|nr:hypothetical protein CVT24_006309 [Panaeolus cyanescens]